MISKYISNTRHSFINVAFKMQDFMTNLGKKLHCTI